MIHITVNGKELSVREGMTVLEAAKANGIYIPTLCAYEGMKPKAACRLCVVEVEGESGDKLACALKVKDGMVITTDSEALFEKRKAAVQEMFRQHRVDCHHCLRIGSTKAKDFDPAFCRDCYFCDCVRDGFCELQAKALEFGIDQLPFEIHEHDFALDDSTGSLVRDPNKCIKCRRCADMCKSQGVGILGMVRTENGQIVGAKSSLMADGCIRCGRCVSVCPTGALVMKEHKDEEIYFAHSYDTETAAMLSEDILRELEDLFGAPRASFSVDKVADGLQKIGIDRVYYDDVPEQLSAAEAAKLLDERLGSGCLLMAEDYAAKNFLELNYPQLREHFLFYGSAQKHFGDFMHANCPGVKLYHISARNSFGAEAAETGSADYFINPRELYRIFLRTGVDPARRKGIRPEQLFPAEHSEKYGKLLRAGEWCYEGEAQEVSFSENSRSYKALICRNPGQFAAAAERMDSYDVIRLLA